MDIQKNLSLIKALSEANGASGFEDEVIGVLAEATKGLGNSYRDSMLNFYLERKENAGSPTVLIDAHTDEVSFMVHSVNPDGTINFVALGGWVAYCVPAHPVRVQNAEGVYIPGVVASKPPHFLSDAERAMAPKLENMVIDVGATSRQDAIENFKIRVAAPIVPDVEFRYLEGSGLLYGKAFDCRLGCAAAAVLLQQLEGKSLAVDVKAAWAVQEEVGLRGAKVTSNKVAPAAAIVFEGTPADDTINSPYPSQTAIKSGPMLRHIDSGMITNPRFQRFALDLAKEAGIAVQEAVRTGGSTNGASIHLSQMGVPTIVIGIPVRYIHTHHGFASYADWEAAVKLGALLLERLDAETIASF